MAALAIVHPFVSTIADVGDTSLVQPSNWNDVHTVTADATGTTGRILIAQGSGAAPVWGTSLPLAMSFADGSVGAPSIAFTNDLTTGFYRIGTGNIGIACSGTKIFDISTTATTITTGNLTAGAVTYSGGTSTAQIYTNSLTTPIVVGTSATPQGLTNNPTVWIQQVPAGIEQGSAMVIARWGGVQTGASSRWVSGNGPAAWSAVTTYSAGEYVSYSSVYYRALQITLNDQPDISPSDWVADPNAAVKLPTALGTNALMSELRFDAIGTNTGIASGASNGFITLALIEGHTAGVVPNAQCGGGGEIDFRQAAGKEATVTFNTGTDEVNWTAHALPVNTTVVFRTTATLPAELTAGTTYYVKAVTGSGTFTLSATAGGATINLTTAGSGTITGMAFQTATIRTFETRAPSIGDTHYPSFLTAQSGGNLEFLVDTDSGSGSVGLNFLLAGTTAATYWANSATPTSPIFKIQSLANAVNYVEVTGAVSGGVPEIRGYGTGTAGDNNVSLLVNGRGTGQIILASASTGTVEARRNMTVVLSQNGGTSMTVSNTNTGLSANAGFALTSNKGTFTFATYSVAAGGTTNISTPFDSGTIIDLRGSGAATGGALTVRQNSGLNTVFAIGSGASGGQITMPANLTATTTGTGTLVVTGGVGISAALFAGSYNVSVDRSILCTNQTSAAAAAAGTLGNAPAAGDPGFWLKIKVNGTNYAVPCWAG